MWSSAIFGTTAALFVAMSLGALTRLRWARRLPAAPDAAGDGPARCSIVVAARDEEARLEATIRRMLAQQRVELEILVVDDRSTDRTGEIGRRLAAEDSRVRVIRVDVLPEGWLGKCHACHVGASAATGDWLLFSDADCWLRADVIARALAVAARDGADHLTLTPGVAGATWNARAWHLALLTRLTTRLAAVNQDRPGAFFGIGAFNLVRASVYRASGGYEALRLTVIDDVKLGLLVRRAGGKTRAFIGGEDALCHWGTSVPAMLGIMEKNYFAAADYRLGPVVAAAMVMATLVGAAVVGPWTGTAAGIAAGIAPWSLSLPAAVLARRLGWPLACALLTPLQWPVLVYAVVNSAVVTVRRGGVRWRETFYPLDLLRRGNVR